MKSEEVRRAGQLPRRAGGGAAPARRGRPGGAGPGELPGGCGHGKAAWGARRRGCFLEVAAAADPAELALLAAVAACSPAENEGAASSVYYTVT